MTRPAFYPIDLEFLAVDSVCENDLYLHQANEFILYRASQLNFSNDEKNRLLDSSIRILYIQCETEETLRRFYEKNLPNILSNPKINSDKKATVLHECAVDITKKIFDKPHLKENIGRSKQIVDHTVELMALDTNAFLKMISLSSHDYYTYNHCVNVMTFSIALLSKLGFNDFNLLKKTGYGALLHDIGKAKIPLKILNKPSSLNEEEWAIMKKHPSIGYDMLDQTFLPDLGKNIIVQHHEKINGTGYPHGLKIHELPIVSQVVSICDAYDAMTSNRCYQKALSPFQAFDIITQKLRGYFDPYLVEQFIHLLNIKKEAGIALKHG